MSVQDAAWVAAAMNRADEAHARSTAVTVVTATFLAIAWLATILRFWVRGVLIRSLGPDDWVMLFTNVIYTIYCSFLFLINVYGPQLMLGQATLDQDVLVFKYLLGSIAFYIATTIFFKIALGLFYLRVMVRPWQKYIVYGTVGFATVFGMAFFFLAIFQCGNPVNFLEKELSHQCVSDQSLLAMNLTAGLVNALADWTLALLPVFVLRKASMPLPAKISAGCLMALGTVGSICSVVRLGFVESFKPDLNFFWHAVILELWSVAECGICITAASMATLRPLFKCCMENARTFMPTFGSRRRGYSHSKGTWKSGEQGSVPTADFSFQDRARSPDLELQNDPRTITTVIGNARAMEKLGITHESVVREAGLKRSESSRSQKHIVSQMAAVSRHSERGQEQWRHQRQRSEEQRDCDLQRGAGSQRALLASRDGKSNGLSDVAEDEI